MIDNLLGVYGGTWEENDAIKTGKSIKINNKMEEKIYYKKSINKEK